MDLGLSGLASGFDWHTLISQLIEVERAPETRMRTEQNTLDQQNNAYEGIKTQLTTLQARIQTLNDPTLFDSRTSQSSDSTVATVTAGTGTTAGSYVFDFTQLATAARQRGAANVANSLNSSDNLSGLLLSNAGLSTKVTTGNFAVNGTQVSVESTDTLADVFTKISDATGGSVSGSYDPSSDKISLSSDAEIVLGSATDTSNFLQAMKLANNASGLITSSAALGGAALTEGMTKANLKTKISDGGQGAGQFLINGVSISFNATEDSIQNVLDKINSSQAGVTATYDNKNNQFTLTNKTTGDVGISLQDVTGNFLAATGLLPAAGPGGGTLEHGKDLLYTINGGAVLSSHSNTITDASSGLTGLSVTAMKKDNATVTVGTDTSKIKGAIQDFLSEYNKAQTLISNQTASSTDAKGVVTAGILASDSDANSIAATLRSLAYTQVSSLSDIKGLSALGIDTNGNDNTLSLNDETKLDSALSDHLDIVKQLFTDSTNGLAAKLNDYVGKTLGDSGTLATKQSNLTKQSGSIDTQIADLERQLTDEQQRLTDSFVAMETAQAQSNQQLQYLQKNFA